MHAARKKGSSSAQITTWISAVHSLGCVGCNSSETLNPTCVNVSSKKHIGSASPGESDYDGQARCLAPTVCTLFEVVVTGFHAMKRRRKKNKKKKQKQPAGHKHACGSASTNLLRAVGPVCGERFGRSLSAGKVILQTQVYEHFTQKQSSGSQTSSLKTTLLGSDLRRYAQWCINIQYDII